MQVADRPILRSRLLAALVTVRSVYGTPQWTVKGAHVHPAPLRQLLVAVSTVAIPQATLTPSCLGQPAQ